MAETTSIIRIYPSFTEIRQNVKTSSPHQIYFPQDLYNQIMNGSLNLEGVNVQSINAVTKENNLEGKNVHVNRNKETREVKVIRSRDLLVQDLQTGRYFNADRNSIEYIDVPEETGTDVTFVLEKPGPATLSYLMYGINWKPRYSFNITGDEHTFLGWADITNNTQKEYVIEKTELFGGDVAITQSHRGVVHYEACMMMSAPRMMADAAPKIQAQGEVSGLYMYSIPETYTLQPRSTFSLPFAEPIIELKRVGLMNSYFNSFNSKGQSSRVYRIKSNQFLPSGNVTVREDGRVVGQSNLQDLSANENTDLTVGNDPEVSYERSVKTLVHNENTSHYDVRVTVKNRKSRIMNYEYVETFSGRYEVDGDNGLKIENDYVKSEGEIEANGEKSFKFSVKFFYN